VVSFDGSRAVVAERDPNPRRRPIPTPEFWRDRRVLVTGHTGFKGAWLAAWLLRMGARVSGFALPPATDPSLYLAGAFQNDLRSTYGDVRDHDAVLRAVAAEKPDVVLHLAAQPIVRRSYDDPAGTFATNVLGTVHVLDAVRQVGSARAVVVVTSDKCYENREWVWSYREKSALGGRDPYSASKACAEIVTRSFRNSFFKVSGDTFVGTARAGNVVGGGDWAEDRLVPDTVRALRAGRPVELRYPSAVRPWQHVLEPLSGYLKLAENLHSGGDAFAEGWNFAPWEEDARTVGWVAERLQRAWGVTPAWRPQEGARHHEHIFLKLDSSKARMQLGWQPRLRIRDTIDWTVDWYRAFYDGVPACELVEQQIARYETVAVPTEAERVEA
jgi:CDP-glucose 4,6-dehydratase